MFNDNIFYLNKEVFNNLSSMLYEILCSLYSYNDITSAYITPYKNSLYKGQLNITILINDDANIYYYKRIVNKINNDLSNTTSFPILFCVDYENEYNLDVNKSSSLIRIEELLSSDILFDKNNFLKSLENLFVNKEEFTYYFDLIEFIPSLSEDVALKLFKNRMI